MVESFLLSLSLSIVLLWFVPPCRWNACCGLARLVSPLSLSLSLPSQSTPTSLLRSCSTTKETCGPRFVLFLRLLDHSNTLWRQCIGRIRMIMVCGCVDLVRTFRCRRIYDSPSIGARQRIRETHESAGRGKVSVGRGYCRRRDVIRPRKCEMWKYAKERYANTRERDHTPNTQKTARCGDTLLHQSRDTLLLEKTPSNNLIIVLNACIF